MKFSSNFSVKIFFPKFLPRGATPDFKIVPTSILLCIIFQNPQKYNPKPQHSRYLLNFTCKPALNHNTRYLLNFTCKPDMDGECLEGLDLGPGVDVKKAVFDRRHKTLELEKTKKIRTVRISKKEVSLQGARE